MDYGYKTDKGLIREHNEDSFLFCNEKEYVLIAVADGMGGHNAGDIASTLAIEEVSNFNSHIGFKNDLEQKLLNCVRNANKRVFEQSLKNNDLGGMGTTLTIAVLKENQIYVAHVGDSRAYVINDKIKKLTTDHSYVEELKKAGKISDEEAKIHPSRNQITRAVGTEKEVEIDFYHATLLENDVVLLCSDGLTNMIDENEILNSINSCINMQEAVDTLVMKANENGGADNITIVGLKISADKNSESSIEGGSIS